MEPDTRIRINLHTAVYPQAATYCCMHALKKNYNKQSLKKKLKKIKN